MWSREARSPENDPTVSYRSALALITRAALQEVIKLKFMLIVDLKLMSDFLELYLWARRHKSRLIHAGGMQTANSKSKAICPRDGHRSRGTQSSVMSALPPIYILFTFSAQRLITHRKWREKRRERRTQILIYKQVTFEGEIRTGTTQTPALRLKKKEDG